ncbi:MAG TPA: molybdopterin-dependent oxidoreductase [Phenylobacterium sp.]|uniref:molybdopterin-containing oxidoreductase family protein n=1 Tax=Phenylobacterium sp. TaxID=1871053 RepID=UPI002B463375|nr:molybdopterin-dependent oxidoreductase [Phenylobacterium sp.]HKR89629.1 molybdopterin-dependent oxidoreductase [Phenylobacterium sp.]
MSDETSTRQVFSYCRGCVSYCGLKFEVAGNEILSHGGNRDHVSSAGYKCIKADMSVEVIQGKERRFASAMKRDASGQLSPIDKHLALDEIAEKIRRSIEQHGPSSVALYIGTAGYRKSFNLSMAKQFMGKIGSPSVFSTMTIDQSAHWVVDGRMGVFASGKPQLGDIDLVILSGTNPVISRGGPYHVVPTVNHIPQLQEYRKRGGKMIIVDPRATETSRIADLYIQPRPGFDTEIFAALIRLVLQNGYESQAFCNRYVMNLEALRAAVEPFTPDMVAERAGITAVELHEAARMIGAARRLSMGFGTGTSMSPNPNTAAHMIEGLNAICGGFVRAGDVYRNAGVYSAKPRVETVIPPSRSWETGPKIGNNFGAIYGEFPSSRIPDEILTPGPTQIRTLIVLGANPMMAFGQPERMREALGALDCLVVIEPRSTETTELAHYVIAPPLQYEVADINLLIAEWAYIPYIQYTDPVVQPPPGLMEEWKIFNGLANRLGHTITLSPYTFGSAGDASAGTELTMDRTWRTEELIEITLAGVGTSIAELRNHPNGLKRHGDVVRVFAPEVDDGARLDACPEDVRQELAVIAQTSTDGSPRRYRLVGRRITELMNSEFRNSERLINRFDGAAPLYVNPEDMAAEGLEPGQAATITGDHGKITARVRPDPTLRRGVVAMPHCWNGVADAGSAADHTSWLVSLALKDVQPIDGMPQQSSLPVDLTPA